MEKPSYTKHHSICSTARNMKQMHDFDLMAAGFSWPPRSYVCSFCKREFRSAQALGGHMNVHRRDRARLRQSPPRDNGGTGTPSPTNNNGAHFSDLLNLNFKPNPSFPLSSPLLSTKFPPPSCGGDAAPAHYRRPVTTDLMKLKAAKGLHEASSACKKGFVSLELGMGLISPSKEKLDLELRLGFN